MFLIGGKVFSKYLSKVKGEGIAQIANWNFLVNEQEEKIQKIQLVNTCNTKTLVNGKIAPGTSGEFEIRIDATGSEVGIDYKIEFQNESNRPSHLKYSFEGKEYQSITQLQEVLKGSISAEEENKIKKLKIQWIWPYETGNNEKEIQENDKIDTQEAKVLKNYQFDILVSGIQTMPQS